MERKSVGERRHKEKERVFRKSKRQKNDFKVKRQKDYSTIIILLYADLQLTN